MPIEIRELHIKVTVKDAEASSPAEELLPDWMMEAARADAAESLPGPTDASFIVIGAAGWADDAIGLL